MFKLGVSFGADLLRSRAGLGDAHDLLEEPCARAQLVALELGNAQSLDDPGDHRGAVLGEVDGRRHLL